MLASLNSLFSVSLDNFAVNQIFCNLDLRFKYLVVHVQFFVISILAAIRQYKTMFWYMDGNYVSVSPTETFLDLSIDSLQNAVLITKNNNCYSNLLLWHH